VWSGTLDETGTEPLLILILRPSVIITGRLVRSVRLVGQHRNLFHSGPSDWNRLGTLLDRFGRGERPSTLAHLARAKHAIDTGAADPQSLAI
jgi:hypothetical protein